MAHHLLIVEDEVTLCESLVRVLRREGHQVRGVHSAEDALEAMESSSFDLMITDIILPEMGGLELLRRARRQSPDMVTIVMTAYASTETAVEALRAGAFDYIMKPIIHEEIRKIVENALRQRALASENLLLKRQVARSYDFENIIGRSDGIRQVMDEIRKIADARSNILITGETGTGKELFARAIHHNSSRSDRPFVPINCSAIPEQLLESELFGFIRGAFTGALQTKKGLFEEADGGTIFLDEVGELSPPFQAKLLRVLEDQEIRPIGSTQSRKVDVRIISATNRDIERAVSEGRFREDLLYRINVVTITLPPLKDRDGDVRLLAEHFTARFAAEMGKNVSGISDEAMKVFESYHWPGNVRELQNVVERAVLLSEDGEIRAEHLPKNVARKHSFLDQAVSKKLSIEDYTRAFILEHEGSHSEQEIADMLGITRKTLWEKRKKWNLKR